MLKLLNNKYLCFIKKIIEKSALFYTYLPHYYFFFQNYKKVKQFLLSK